MTPRKPIIFSGEWDASLDRPSRDGRVWPRATTAKETRLDHVPIRARDHATGTPVGVFHALPPRRPGFLGGGVPSTSHCGALGYREQAHDSRRAESGARGRGTMRPAFARGRGRFGFSLTSLLARAGGGDGGGTGTGTWNLKRAPLGGYLRHAGARAEAEVPRGPLGWRGSPE